MLEEASSPSRKYVAICRDTFRNRKGVIFRKFYLPEPLSNTTGIASHYFMNHIDLTSMLFGVVTFEDYGNLVDYTILSEGKDNDNQS